MVKGPYQPVCVFSNGSFEGRKWWNLLSNHYGSL